MSRIRPRSSFGAFAALSTYVYALVAAPWLHAEHHARRGADHVHDASGTHAITASTAEPNLVDLSQAHAAFHADLAALALDDAATAGTLVVDCSLVAYTLADCGPSDAGTHAPRFGDALVTHRHPVRSDTEHGKGSLEHLAKALLCPQLVALPPPSAPHATPLMLLADAQRCSTAVAAPQARGPPPSSRMVRIS